MIEYHPDGAVLTDQDGDKLIVEAVPNKDGYHLLVRTNDDNGTYVSEADLEPLIKALRTALARTRQLQAEREARKAEHTAALAAYFNDQEVTND